MIRVSLGPGTTEADIDAFTTALSQTIAALTPGTLA